MGRRHGALRAAGAAASLIWLLAAAATAQGEPSHWQQFAGWRDELRLDGPGAVRRWGDKADARLAWLHRCVTAERPDEEFDRWFATDAAATVHDLHAAMRQRADTDWPSTLAEVMHLVQWWKGRGRYDAAGDLLDDVLSWLGTERSERFEFLLQLGECRRRAYRWDRAAGALDAADALAGSRAAAFQVHVQRAALLLARGLPDLAVAAVEAAEQAAGDPTEAAQALFVRLRLEHSLRRPERAMARLRELLAGPLPPPSERDDAWRRRMAQLRIRAALAVLADPAWRSSDEAEAVAWLREAIAEPATSNDERVLARTVLVSHLLDRGQVDGVADELEAAAREVASGSAADLDERRLAVATLSLRHARLAARDELRRDRAAALARLWHLLVDRWHEQPLSRVGEGPLFFGDCRRAFVELLYARLAEGEGAAAAEAVLAEVLRASATGSLARHVGAGMPTAAEVRARLCRDGAGILVFVPGHESSIAVAIDATTTTVHVLGAGALQLDAARRELLRAIEIARQDGDATAWHAPAQRCAELLLPAELGRRLTSWRSLAIVGLESLGYLPFEALPATDGARLGLLHAVSYLPSLPVATWLAAHHASSLPTGSPRVRVLACADTGAPDDAADHPEPLPFHDDHLAPLRAACAGVALEILRDKAASCDAAFGAGGEADVVQVIAHGMRDERRTDPQGVLMGDRTIAWPGDIESMHGARYAFLAVCRAGRGRLRRGDDGRHLLSGALLAGGARAVVLPVADVSYRATLAFTADVHRALWQDGAAVAEALRSARAAAARRGERDGLEACLFHLVGLGDEPVLPASSLTPRSDRWTLPLALGLCVLALGALAGRTRMRRARA